MSDSGVKSYYAEVRQGQRAKREANKVYATAFLIKHKVPFVSLNGGLHLRVTVAGEVIDFYPSTGLWHTPDGLKHRGIFNLWKYVRDRLRQEAGNAA